LKELEASAPPLPKSITFKDTLARALKSCALKVKLNPDLSRRSTITEIYSLKFSEFINLNFPSLFSEHASITKKLPKDFTEVVLNCNNAKDQYEFQMDIQKMSLLFTVPSNIEGDYFYFGGFPFYLGMKLKALLARTPTSSARPLVLTLEI
jgi:predicted AAA+ superfamily ATPase